jgi:uncharacterized protein
MPDPASPREGRCPRCGKRFCYVRVAQHTPYPFCSDRCREIDLGNWLTGKYAIPGAPLPTEPEDETKGGPYRPKRQRR